MEELEAVSNDVLSEAQMKKKTHRTRKRKPVAANQWLLSSQIKTGLDKG
jgi:hypothetical protein